MDGITSYFMYGMRLRGFSPGCQPMEGLVDRWDDPTGRYHDLILYDRKLSDREQKSYELDFLREVWEDSEVFRKGSVLR